MKILFFALYGAALFWWLTFFISSAQSWRLQKRLLNVLQKLRPDSYARLSNALWRTKVDQFELSHYLKSDSDEDDAEISQLKAQCRKWNRRFVIGLVGFVGVFALAAAVGGLTA